MVSAGSSASRDMQGRILQHPLLEAEAGVLEGTVIRNVTMVTAANADDMKHGGAIGGLQRGLVAVVWLQWCLDRWTALR